MKPDEFLERQYEQSGKHHTYKEWENSVNRENIELLKKDIKDPKQFVPVPIEEYDRYGDRQNRQEGRHRGIAARELGIKIPVIIGRKKVPPWDRVGDNNFKHRIYDVDVEDEDMTFENLSKNNKYEKEKDKFPLDDETSKDATMYRGVDDKEFLNLRKEGKLKPHGERNAIWMTPSKSIAERYNKNILSLNVDDDKVFPVEGRSKMFITNQKIPLDRIKKVESYPGLLINDKPVEEKWHSIEPEEESNYINADDIEDVYIEKPKKDTYGKDRKNNLQVNINDKFK